MANKKITELNNFQTPVANSVFVVVDLQNDETKKVTLSNLQTVIDTIATSNINTVQDNVTSLTTTVNVSPNPVKSTLRTNKIANVKLYDITGKVTLEVKQVNIIDVSALTPGVYNLHVEINSRTLKYKIIKQ